MKRILSILLVVLMVMGAVPGMVFAADAIITAEADKTSADIGDIIEVTYTLTNNPGFTNVGIRLDFDEEVLKFKGLKTNEYDLVDGMLGTAVANTEPYSEQYGFITFAKANAVTKDGKLFVAVFEVIGSGSVTAGADIELFQKINAGVAEDVTAPTVTATEEITVGGIPATAVTVTPETKELEVLSNYRLAVTVEPANSTDKVVWTSSDETVATVDNTGRVNALKVGTATITATAGDVSDTCEITVKGEESIVGKRYTDYAYQGGETLADLTGIKKMTFKGEELTLKNVYKLSINGFEGFHLINKRSSFTSGFIVYTLGGKLMISSSGWETDISDVSMNYGWAGYNWTGYMTKDYLVSYVDLEKAFGDEVSKLGVTENDMVALMVAKGMDFDYATIIVHEPVAATAIEITESMMLVAGNTETASVTLTPASSTDVPTWTSSDETVATVDKDGVVTAVKEGTATITATIGEIKDTCEVTVFAEAASFKAPRNDAWGFVVDSIEILGVTVDDYKWNGQDLTVYITDETATAHVTVKHNSGSDKGTVEVTNYEGHFNKYYDMGWNGSNWNVYFKKSVPTTKITLDKTEVTGLLIGRNETLTATLDEGSTSSVVWSSSDENVATVDQNGKVTAVAKGTATITAQVYGSDLKAECVVNVIAVHADAIDIVLYNNDGTTTEPENGKIRIRLGDSFRLKAVTDPEEITDDVVWSTSDENIAQINSWNYVNGERVANYNPSFFVAKAPGTAKIKVTSSYDDGINAGSVSKTVEVEVYEIPAETITLDKAEATLLYGETLKLTATVNPTNHTDGSVQWISSDENVVTVDGRGNITVKGAGEATVTAKIKDIEATCKITVPEFYMQTEELPTFTLSTVGWPGQVDKLAISGREVVKVEWNKDESGKLLPSATVILKEGTEDGTKLIGVMDYSIPSYNFNASSTKTVTVEGGKAEMDLQYGYYSGLFGGNVKLTFMDESLLPVYGFEVVFDKDEYKENEDAVAKVYLKNYRNKDLDANVLGYALSFNEDAFVVKNTQAGENLVDELSTKEDGLIVRKLRLEADVEDFAIAQEGILIDTITFKAVGDGMINAELTAVENDVDLNDESTFVTVFIEETAQAENVLTDGTVTYTRIVSEDKAKAAVVDEIIAKIGETVEFSDFEIMHQAREAYENLEDEVKQYVEKLDVLEETEKCHAFWKNGDVNVDGVINGQDLSIILGTYGEEVTELNAHCDINVDEMSEGLINGGDLSVVLGSYATIIE